MPNRSFVYRHTNRQFLPTFVTRCPTVCYAPYLHPFFSRMIRSLARTNHFVCIARPPIWLNELGGYWLDGVSLSISFICSLLSFDVAFVASFDLFAAPLPSLPPNNLCSIGSKGPVAVCLLNGWWTLARKRLKGAMTQRFAAVVSG